MKAKSRMLVFGALMLGGALLAYVLTPTQMISGRTTPVDLATLVPERFGQWRLDTNSVPIALAPELEAQQKEIYDQMLVRTYVDADGERIMLTIAYGANQSRNLQVHRPEVCYAALGFQVTDLRKVSLSSNADAALIPAMQLVARQRARNEPVTYWIRIGDQVVRGNAELGIARLNYGLRGYIVDGLLFRVSNITPHDHDGFELQQRFVVELLGAMPEPQRRLLVGGSARVAG